MLIVLLVIFMALLILGVYLYNNTNSVVGTAVTCAVGGSGAFFTVIILIITIIDVSHGIIIDDKINLYESENNKIDKQVYSIVENYKGYEKGTFKSVKDKNADTLISLYPELKTDALVKVQIKIYTSNRKEIIKLKQEKLEQKPLRWWLYFGG